MPESQKPRKKELTPEQEAFKKHQEAVKKYNEAVKQFEEEILTEQRAARYNKAIFEKMDYYIKYNALKDEWTALINKNMMPSQTTSETISPEHVSEGLEVFEKGVDPEVSQQLDEMFAAKIEEVTND